MRRREISFRHLFLIDRIAKTGSISRAAGAENLSQSAATQALRKVERVARTRLFDRYGRGVVATAAGTVFVRRIARARSLLARAERELRQREPVIPSQRRLYETMTAGELRALIAVVDTDGFSAAARSLGLAQPTVYRAVRGLEERLGIALFRRLAKRTDALVGARLLARHAELAFAEIRQGFEELDELDGNMRSRIAVGCLPLARARLLPDAVASLLDTYPNARVSIMDGPYPEQLHALRRGRIDWVVGALRDPCPAPDVEQSALFEEALTIVVRSDHPMLERRSPQPDALARLHWIAPRRGTPARDLFESFFSRHGHAPPEHIIECSSLLTARALLRASDRAALLSPSQVEYEIDTGQLATLGGALRGTARTIGVTTRRSWQPTAVQATLTRLIRYHAGDIMPGHERDCVETGRR